LASWDVSELHERHARIEIVDTATDGRGHVNVLQISMGDERMAQDARADVLYGETCGPQFRLTPTRNWSSDAHWRVYCKGDYHLFFQHRPRGVE